MSSGLDRTRIIPWRRVSRDRRGPSRLHRPTRRARVRRRRANGGARSTLPHGSPSAPRAHEAVHERATRAARGASQRRRTYARTRSTCASRDGSRRRSSDGLPRGACMGCARECTPVGGEHHAGANRRCPDDGSLGGACSECRQRPSGYSLRNVSGACCSSRARRSSGTSTRAASSSPRSRVESAAARTWASTSGRLTDASVTWSKAV